MSRWLVGSSLRDKLAKKQVSLDWDNHRGKKILFFLLNMNEIARTRRKEGNSFK